MKPNFVDYTGPYELMIDLETLGTDPGCFVKTAAFVPWTKAFGAFGDNWSMTIVLPVLGNGSVDVDTVFWWFNQAVNKGEAGVEATKAMLSEPTHNHVKFALTEVSGLIKNALHVWANGPTFDLSILEWLYKHNGLEVPWNFWSERCVRTATDGKERPPRSGAHEASADCFHQIDWILS